MAGQGYDNTNRGCLFKNKKKATEKQPDYTGKLDIDGTEYFISGWIKKSQAGETYLSLARQIRQEDKGGQGQRSKPAGDDKPFDDADIPF